MKYQSIISNKVFYFVVFLFFFIFYYLVHPVIPFDTDDWWYNGISRPLYPKLGLWNPTKVFPETLQPLINKLSSLLLLPITKDYFKALTMGNALTLSLFISIYLYLVQKLITKYCTISRINAFLIVIIYALLHFYALKVGKENNDYLLYSRDVTCYYHYTLSNLINAILVLWIIVHDKEYFKNIQHLCILILVSYFALFSNLYSSVLLVAYVGANLIINLISSVKDKEHWLTNYIKNNVYYLSIIFLWLVLQLIEINGNRANSYGYLNKSFGASFMETIRDFILNYYNINHTFIVITFLSIAISMIVICKRTKNLCNLKKVVIIVFLSLNLTFLYLLLLSSKVKPEYVNKGDVLFCFLFFYLILFTICISYLCSKYNILKILLPFAIFILFFEIHTHSNTFRDVEYWNGTNLQSCINFNTQLLDAIKIVEQEKKDSITIQVHQYNVYQNWPLDYEHQHYIGETLYKHGVTSRYINVYLEPSTELEIGEIRVK